jgi:hypothetical protein
MRSESLRPSGGAQKEKPRPKGAARVRRNGEELLA